MPGQAVYEAANVWCGLLCDRLANWAQQEFAEIHSNAAHLQLESFYIGRLAQ